jgi:hypothetical protein
MNPARSLYARMTLNGKRTDLGFAAINIIFVRAAQVYQSTPSKGSEITMTLELSASKLPDTSILNREAMVEQSLAAQIVTDPSEESPFEGITMGRVQEAMASPEYATWYQYCQPDNRLGVDVQSIQDARQSYLERFPDCFPHFPKWIDS